jgi:hypothetical protein
LRDDGQSGLLHSAFRHISPLARIGMGYWILNCRKHRQYVPQMPGLRQHRFRLRNDGGPAIAEASKVPA